MQLILLAFCSALEFQIHLYLYNATRQMLFEIIEMFFHLMLGK